MLFHCSEANDLETQQHICPRTADSWCKYQADKIKNTNTCKQEPGIPAIIRDKIKPVFLNLSDDRLLSKCLHGKTQNINEAINSVIWKRCPKDVFAARQTLELGVSAAVISYNDGASGLLNIFHLIKIKPGIFCEQDCTQTDKNRVEKMELKSLDCNKQRRKKLRAIRKGFADKDEEQEGVVYGAELF